MRIGYKHKTISICFYDPGHWGNVFYSFFFFDRPCLFTYFVWVAYKCSSTFKRPHIIFCNKEYIETHGSFQGKLPLWPLWLHNTSPWAHADLKCTNMISTWGHNEVLCTVPIEFIRLIILVLCLICSICVGVNIEFT